MTLPRTADGKPDVSSALNPDGTLNEAEWERLSELAFAEKRAKIEADEKAHAAFHRQPEVRYRTVERRPGYRGRTVCIDCYYGTEWRGQA